MMTTIEELKTERRGARRLHSTGGGEIIEVQGGHIVRSTGRKDRHSKVYTAKGPRDRRVRLSAHTAIQFYDVQDRLGYDRPSKAVDWLIDKAQSAIDKLAHLPPWHPTADVAPPEQSESNSGYNLYQSLDPDAMKLFFPASSSVYPPEIMIPGTTNEDLCLSLHSFATAGGGSSPVSFDPSFQRMVSWGSEQDENRGGAGGFVFGSPPQQSLLFCSPREPLQSSFGLPEFCLPTQIHGQGEDRGDPEKPPASSSPSSRH